MRNPLTSCRLRRDRRRRSCLPSSTSSEVELHLCGIRRQLSTGRHRSITQGALRGIHETRRFCHQGSSGRKGWFKIWEESYDSNTSQWCTEKLTENNGVLSVKIPGYLAGGYYLVRPELLTLHQADKSPPNPQFYVGCAQIFLNSTANMVPQDTVKIPGYVNITDQSVLFNIYTPEWPYITPGPEVYKAGSSSSILAKPIGKQTEGLLPNNAILENANWWAVELDSYSDEAGCDNVSNWGSWRAADFAYHR